jgi:microcystin-dependent protein
MAEAAVGEIRIFAGAVVPQSWAYCNGAVLEIASNTLLFAILGGHRFGGDGRSTFALPTMPDPGPGLKYAVKIRRDDVEREGYLGEIRLFAGQDVYMPRGWAPCDGRVRDLTNEARPGLISIIGDQFGGDGQITYNLPLLADPVPDVKYIICTDGVGPVAAP